MMSENIELIPEESSKPEKNLKPRDKSKKNTDASPTAFGWNFQIVSGILLSIKNIKELSRIEIEGNTEDIELYFVKANPEYVQAKAIQKNPIDNKDNNKASLAMNTLINTSNITQGKYSKLVYIVNFMNPLGLKENILRASWQPSMNEIFYQPYSALNSYGKTFIDKKIQTAKNQLMNKGYDYSTKYFDKNKLYIATALFDSNDQNEQRFNILSSTFENFFNHININVDKDSIENIINMFVKGYFMDAGSNEKCDKHLKITKKRLVWKMIFKIIKELPQEFKDDIDPEILPDLDKYQSDFIKKQSEDIDVINKITAGFLIYLNENSIKNVNSQVISGFTYSNWKKYEEIFPEDKDKEIQENGIKVIILRILCNRRLIKKIQKGTGLN